GRTARADRHDVVLDRAKMAKTRAFDFVEAPLVGLHARWEGIAVESQGDEALLRYEATAQMQDGWFRTWASEMKLKKTVEGWKIAFVRSWPSRGLEGGRGVAFDADWWKARDAEVDQAEGLAKARLLLRNLRPADALALLRQRTTAKDATAADWSLLGEAALRA